MAVRRVPQPLTVPPVIISFSGVWRFLSNFAPCQIELDAEMYPSVENAYQAAKSTSVEYRMFCRKATAGSAKRAGRKVELRSDWEQIKHGMMRWLLLKKFSPGKSPDYLSMLLATGDAKLIEGNDWGDQIWGCVHLHDGVGNPYWVEPETGRKWFGENRLGEDLMRIRKTRRAQQPSIMAVPK